MRKPYEQSERAALIRAVQQGEAAVAAATRLGVGVSTAYRWLRAAAPARAARPRRPTSRPVFIEVAPERDRERVAPASVRVRVGVAELEVTAGFDAGLLRAVVAALGANA
jgi:transposase-like protein